MKLSYIEFHDGEIEGVRLRDRCFEIMFSHLTGYVKEAEEKYGEHACRIRFIATGVVGLEWSFFNFSEWVGDGAVLINGQEVKLLTSETLVFNTPLVKLSVTSIASGRASWVTAESMTMVIEAIGERFDEFNGPIGQPGA